MLTYQLDESNPDSFVCHKQGEPVKDSYIQWLTNYLNRIVWNDYETYGREKLGRPFDYTEDDFDYFDGKRIGIIRFYIPKWEDDAGNSGTGFTQLDIYHRMSSMYNGLVTYRYLNQHKEGILASFTNIAHLLDGGRYRGNPLPEKDFENLVNSVLSIPVDELNPKRPEKGNRGRIRPGLDKVSTFKAVGKLKGYCAKMDKIDSGIVTDLRDHLKGWDYEKDGKATPTSLARMAGVPRSTVVMFLPQIEKAIDIANFLGTDSEIREVPELGVKVSAKGVVYSKQDKAYTIKGKRRKYVRIYNGKASPSHYVEDLMRSAGFLEKTIQKACEIR